MKRHGLFISGKSKPYVVAHRGNSVVCPENTIAAFKRAFDDGADILETDLQVTADGVFVCIHDEEVDRTTNGSGSVSLMDLAEIKTLSASCGFAGFEEERIPTLAELASILPRGSIVALELKSARFLEEAVCRRLIYELDELAIREKVVVLSFSSSQLSKVREIAPDTPIGLITTAGLCPPDDTDLLGPVWSLIIRNPFYVLTAHRRGQAVCPLDP
ncbi:MAG: glycerophosphodiester phosphodiesterase family protein, partial [Dehalococcoidia bacterium]